MLVDTDLDICRRRLLGTHTLGIMVLFNLTKIAPLVIGLRAKHP